MGHRRAAVHGHGDQLHRPADDRGFEAHAARRIRLERGGLRQHRVLVPDGLCHRLRQLRPHRRPPRRSAWLCPRHRHLDDQPHGARPRDRCRLVRRGALRARDRRIRELSGGHQRSHRMVSPEGAGLRDRPVQCRGERGGDHHAAAGAGAGPVVRLAGGLLSDRAVRRVVAGGVVGGLSPPRRASPRVDGRTRLDPAGSTGPRRNDRLGQADLRTRDLGLCPRQVPDRPDLVVLPILAAGLPVRPL